MVTLLSLVYLTSSSITILINYVGFASYLAIGVAVFCLPYLRWKRPELTRPIRVNLVLYSTTTTVPHTVLVWR